jgi:hypothetical protein
MDFLDPKRKKSHGNRLLLGYLLIAVAVSMATWLLLNSSFGYWVDPKTGDVIQNGTVFIDSQPGNSTITLDGKVQGNRTSTRLVLPGSRQYNVVLTQDGYRDWSRTFSLGGGSIERLVYPLLLPKTLTTLETQLYASAPSFYSQSLDRRWLLIQQVGQDYSFDLYDLNSPKSAPVTLAIPSNLITDAAKSSNFTAIAWAGDNRHVLLDRAYADTHEYIMLDTSSVTNSTNINTALNVNPSSVVMRDKKADQLYIYDAEPGTIRLGDLKNRTVSTAIINNALAYKTYGNDIILYATRQGAAEGKLSYRIRDNDKANYLLKNVPDTAVYMLDISEYNGNMYFAVGSPVDEAVFLYRNPISALKGQNRLPLVVSAVLRLADPQFMSFSHNSQFISVQSSSKLTVYDIEGDRQYKINLIQEVKKTDKLAWMDGYRLLYISKEQSYIIDFDGGNNQPIVPSLGSNAVYFAPDYKSVFALAPSLSATGRTTLTQTSLLKK